MQADPGRGHPWPGEGRDGGISNTMLRLASLLEKTGQSAEAETWYRRGVELGDARSAAAFAKAFDARGDAAGAVAWRRQAAILARANLNRNGPSLRAAYGESAVLHHTANIAAYADDLAQQGHKEEAAGWYRQAAHYGDTAAAHRSS